MIFYQPIVSSAQLYADFYCRELSVTPEDAFDHAGEVAAKMGLAEDDETTLQIKQVFTPTNE